MSMSENARPGGLFPGVTTMGPVQTLHEFTLNLLSEPQALEAFNADPQAVLNAAGLSDVTAADVHEIIPLVMDTAPASLTETLGSLGVPSVPSLDVPNLDAGSLENAVATVSD